MSDISPLLPPQMQPVAPIKTPGKAVLLERVARLKRQVVIWSVVVFFLFVGFISGAFMTASSWVAGQFTTAGTQQTNDGGNFFNQGGSNSGGSNVGSSSGNAPVSGSGGS